MKPWLQDFNFIIVALLGGTMCFVQAYFLAVKHDFRMISTINEEVRRKITHKAKLGKTLGLQGLIVGMLFIIMPLVRKIGIYGWVVFGIAIGIMIIFSYITMLSLNRNIKKGKY